jgi:uncharacterized protein (UPF0276 family)
MIAKGVGLGFRFSIAEQMLGSRSLAADFVELAPENYMGLGGKRARVLAMARERWPIVCHGLCGDFSGVAPFDVDYMTQLRLFLREQRVLWYSDHLCMTHVAGVETHDLIPLAFNEESVKRAADRIRQVQDYLDIPVAVENVSAYVRMPGGDMLEHEFIRAVVNEANCRLLLDVNNVYVNAHNFGFDAQAFIDKLPLDRVVQIHMAGHEVDDDVLIDTHGSPIVDPVYELMRYALQKLPRNPPILLERDNDIPTLEVLEQELDHLRRVAGAVYASA